MNASSHGDSGTAERRRGDGAADAADATAAASRRRASRSLWTACEALLAAPDDAAMDRALDDMRQAFECDGVAVHALGTEGTLEPWCARGDWRTSAGDLRDCISVPLLRGSERVGALDLQAHAGRCFRPAQLALIRTAAGALGAALGARLELERLRDQPGRDAVTGLPDARSFQARLTEEMSRARRHGVPLAVVRIEIDHFAALVERHGRAVADQVLTEVAWLLKLTLRETDVLARLGSDGFGIVLPETDRGAALRCADRVRHALEERAFARVGRLSTSAGVAAGPRDGVEAVEIVHQAELALAVALKSGHRRSIAVAPTNLH